MGSLIMPGLKMGERLKRDAANSMARAFLRQIQESGQVGKIAVRVQPVSDKRHDLFDVLLVGSPTNPKGN